MRWLSIFLMIGLCGASLPAHAQDLDPFAALKRVGDFPKIDLGSLLDGEILSQRGPLMHFPNGLSSQLVFAVPTSPAETVARLQAFDPRRYPVLKVYASHELHDPGELKEFNSLYLYLDHDLRPVQWLSDQTLATSAKSSTLNLTRSEARELAACVGKASGQKNLGACWAKLLFARASGFQRSGFAGTLPYEFGAESVTAPAHLRSMLLEQPGISAEFTPLLQRAGVLKGAAGTSPLKPSYYWRLFEADHHATLSLGAVYDLAVGDHYQRLEVEYYVSGTYYLSATLYEIWPLRDQGKTGSLVWSDVLCSAPLFRFSTGIERLAAGMIMAQEFKKFIRSFQDSLQTRGLASAPVGKD